ncbi:guanylate kinase [Candidatus Saccharibacteria bacterium]|nr:guanylate kinase [Candidatus Saccharibacteria bacterium]
MQQREEVLIQNYEPSREAIDLLERAHVVLFCGITGAGKDRVQDELSKTERFARIITSTTRAPRENDGVMEQDGREYYFFSRAQAMEKIEHKEYFEVALVHGQINGATVQEIQRIHDAGKTAIGDVDYQGIQYYKKHSPTTLAIFLVPPSFEVWMERLKRRYDTEADFIAAWPKRRDSAIHELEWALSTDLCRIVVNDDLSETVGVVRRIIDGDTTSTGGRAQAHAILDALRAMP